MKLISLIKEAKDEETSAGDVYTGGFLDKGEIVLMLQPKSAAHGTRWNGVKFQLQPKCGEPHVAAGGGSVSEPVSFGKSKKIKLTAKMKKQIKTILTGPESDENLDRLDRAGTSVRDIERYIR